MVSYMQKRGVALFLVCLAFAFGVAAVVDPKWVEDKEASGLVGTYELGLYKWRVRDYPLYGDSAKFDYDELGSTPWFWSEALLGSQSKWKEAGRGALGMGAIALITAGLSGILIILSLAKRDLPKVLPAALAFVSGLSFLLGALIYEGMRPGWAGDIGYEHPMGLYLGAGVVIELAAIFTWWADFEPAKN